MTKFSDKQNEVFSGLFGALKNKGANFTVEAHTLIEFDDENFTKIFTDINCTVTGAEDEISKVNERAKYLELR